MMLKMALVTVLLVGMFGLALDDDMPRGPVTVGRDVVTAGTANSSDTITTPAQNTFYLVMGQITLHNTGVSSTVEFDVTYTNVLGVSTTTTLASIGSGGNGDFTGNAFGEIYAKAGSPVSVSVAFSRGGSATYDLDAVLVKQ